MYLANFVAHPAFRSHEDTERASIKSLSARLRSAARPASSGRVPGSVIPSTVRIFSYAALRLGSVPIEWRTCVSYYAESLYIMHECYVHVVSFDTCIWSRGLCRQELGACCARRSQRLLG